MNSSKGLILLIKGRVQGVGYRDWMVAIARRLRVRGWVRNTRRGDVEALLEGESAAVEALLAAAKEGPSMARVSGIDYRKANDALLTEVSKDFVRLPTV